jgi:hypothetical protein
MQGTKTHRDRKNGASREEWQARKAAANAERPPQTVGKFEDVKGNIHVTRVRA